MDYPAPRHAAAQPAGHTVRTMSLAEYTASRQPTVFLPSTSETVAKVVMALVYLMIAGGIVYVIVESALVG